MRSVPCSGPPSADCSVRSAPAQNIVPVWVSTTARTRVVGRGRPQVRRSSSPTSCADSALRLSGESRVTVAIARSTW